MRGKYTHVAGSGGGGREVGVTKKQRGQRQDDVKHWYGQRTAAGEQLRGNGTSGLI